MIKKAGLLALVVCLFLAWLIPGLVQAGGGLTILDSSARPEFPYRLNFSLSAESDVNITDIRLCYRVDRIGFARVTSEVYIGFASAKTVNIEWPLDMVKIGGLPTGSSLEYWWAVEDAQGDRVETAPAHRLVQFQAVDLRWRLG